MLVTKHPNSRPSETMRQNALARYKDHVQPLGVPYSQHTPEQRRAYNALKNREWRAKRAAERKAKKYVQPDISLVIQGMRSWK